MSPRSRQRTRRHRHALHVRSGSVAAARGSRRLDSGVGAWPDERAPQRSLSSLHSGPPSEGRPSDFPGLVGARSSEVVAHRAGVCSAPRHRSRGAETSRRVPSDHEHRIGTYRATAEADSARSAVRASEMDRRMYDAATGVRARRRTCRGDAARRAERSSPRLGVRRPGRSQRPRDRLSLATQLPGHRARGSAMVVARVPRALERASDVRAWRRRP